MVTMMVRLLSYNNENNNCWLPKSIDAMCCETSMIYLATTQNVVLIQHTYKYICITKLINYGPSVYHKYEFL